MTGCSLCGSTGIHACPGGKIEWTPEKVEKFRRALEKYEPEPIKIDIERMKAALASGSVEMPPGLSREEKRAFILRHAEKQRNP